ncbi:DUF1214 domain-containing protein [Candidatus Tokpelaia sp.]|uniref:DUF1214 domain-containing protein n=1 Tax=Candidatus Tokpelaia sp. TaxID=2233777 RepID=UPI00123A4555|nr:DUF1214 domain-containing protein [Candidatus Tokpelaia sp.]KAA6406249.1 hypothetical protein DPQ22_00605 [Candidatus Tokpelaia sp.]
MGKSFYCRALRYIFSTCFAYPAGFVAALHARAASHRDIFMPRLFARLLIAALIAGIGGGLSVHYALRHFNGFHKVQIGLWTAWPQAETEEADAYVQAKTLLRGDIALGRAEGLSFYLSRDDEGQALNGRCRYIIHGQVPEARFFTLYAIDKERVPIKAKQNWPDKLLSTDIIRDESGAITIILSPRVQDGNWLAVPRGPYALQLNLYDTPITAMIGLTKPSMPSVVKIKERHCG